MKLRLGFMYFTVILDQYEKNYIHLLTFSVGLHPITTLH